MGVLDLKITVINYITRCLMPLPYAADYVTLSYVWGQASGKSRRGTTRRPDFFFGSLRRAASKSTHSKGNDMPLAVPITPHH